MVPCRVAIRAQTKGANRMSALQESNLVPWALLWEKTSSAVPELLWFWQVL